MQSVIRKSLGGGTRLTIVPSGRFKTSVMSACLVLPRGGAEASARAALPRVLRQGTARYPDMLSLAAVLDEMYGARVLQVMRGRGESLVIGFLSDVVDERYADGGEGLTARAAALLGDFWKRPYLIDGTFSPAYTAIERENLADRIEALKNDPRAYAQRRLYEVMCAGEAFGESEAGTAEAARALTPEALSAVYAQALASAPMELFYCGSLPPDAVETAFRTAFGTRPEGAYSLPGAEVRAEPAGAVRTVTEELGVRQGKLALGFRTGVTGADPAYPALMVLNSAFGGSTSSRLFVNVRERLSLCYYASSAIDKQKGVLSVSSGIENDKFEVARDEILRQLTDLQAGGLTEDELEAARRTVLTGLRAMQDSPLSLQDFWMGQAVAGYDWDLAELAARVERVTREEAVAAARRVKLDTVYFLKGVGA